MKAEIFKVIESSNESQKIEILLECLGNVLTNSKIYSEEWRLRVIELINAPK
jgi:hypothetical protein